MQCRAVFEPDASCKIKTSGGSLARKSAWFGTRRPRVQISPARPHAVGSLTEGRFRVRFDLLGRRWARDWDGCGKRLEHAELRDLDAGLPITREAKMGAVIHAVRVVNDGGFVPVRRQPPLVVWLRALPAGPAGAGGPRG